MSVTIDKEIQKAEVLAAGLRKHLEEVGKHGVTEEGIKKIHFSRPISCIYQKKVVPLGSGSEQRKEIYENNARCERCFN